MEMDALFSQWRLFIALGCWGGSDNGKPGTSFCIVEPVF